jgi:hypothetical protein
MKIVLRDKNFALPATLQLSATTIDLIARLPLIQLVFEDCLANSKVTDLTNRLDVTGMKTGHHPVSGDIVYFPPSWSLHIFHSHGEYCHRSIKIGIIDGSAHRMARPGMARLSVDRVHSFRRTAGQ